MFASIPGREQLNIKKMGSICWKSKNDLIRTFKLLLLMRSILSIYVKLKADHSSLVANSFAMAKRVHLIGFMLMALIKHRMY
ncbi:hypothetical protein RC52_17915 [Herbaspirillum rubrisubalbicans]|nr:hypothetical protein [Herbaspirillum rubrisubalbicans]